MSVVQCGTHKLGIKIEKIWNLQARKFYTSHAQNLEEQLWMEGRESVGVISHRCVTSSDFK